MSGGITGSRDCHTTQTQPWRWFEPEFAGGESDAENRLTAVVVTATGHRSEFGYDGFGRRVCIRELDPDQTQTLQVTSDTKYLWDGVRIAESRTADGGTVLQRYYTQGFVDSDGTALFYTRDHLGSIRELTDGQQAIRARYDYDPWGRMTLLQGDRTSPFGFTGDFWHAQSGLDLTLFRAYDPNLGRWISRDPIMEKGGANLYAFTLNSPINLIDPFGLCDVQTDVPKPRVGGPTIPINTPDLGPINIPIYGPYIPGNNPSDPNSPILNPLGPNPPITDDDPGTLPQNLPTTVIYDQPIKYVTPGPNSTTTIIYGYTHITPHQIDPIFITGPSYSSPRTGPGATE